MKIDFVKMHGIGNDFIIIDDRSLSIESVKPYPELAEKLCSRHFGIGADGILLILPSEDHDFKFRIFNSDGSMAQMCGNGLRCVARYVYEQGIIPKKIMQVDTLAGILVPEIITDEDGQVKSVRVDMGEPVLDCSRIPVRCDKDRAVEEPLATDLGTFKITTVSMGNPHAVVFVDQVDETDIAGIGRQIETHSLFPEKTNVEFIEVVGPAELKMRVWERGAGITLACGTGACAALTAASLTGRTENRAVIHLDGGDLDITWDRESNHLFMEGPAELSFEGRVEIG